MNWFYTEEEKKENNELLINSPVYNYKYLSEITPLLYTVDSFSYSPIFSIKLNNINSKIKLSKLYLLVHKRGPFSICIVKNSKIHDHNWLLNKNSNLEYDTTSENCIFQNDQIVFHTLIDSDIHGGTNTSELSLINHIDILSDINTTYTVLARKQSHIKITLNIGLEYIEK